jgi:hypothetical protein
VKGLVDEVSLASRQQSQGIDQVAQAVAQMEKVTQTTAATAEESAAASEELSAQAETAMDVVRQLETLVGAESAASQYVSKTRRPCARRADAARREDALGRTDARGTAAAREHRHLRQVLTMATQTMAAPGKYLTFALGEEEYALPVLRVREIIKMMEITQVPKVPPHVKGVINLRGTRDSDRRSAAEVRVRGADAPSGRASSWSRPRFSAGRARSASWWTAWTR